MRTRGDSSGELCAGQLRTNSTVCQLFISYVAFVVTISTHDSGASVRDRGSQTSGDTKVGALTDINRLWLIVLPGDHLEDFGEARNDSARDFIEREFAP